MNIANAKDPNKLIRCVRCGEDKEQLHFNHYISKHGFSYICRKCRSIADSQRYKFRKSRPVQSEIPVELQPLQILQITGGEPQSPQQQAPNFPQQAPQSPQPRIQQSPPRIQQQQSFAEIFNTLAPQILHVLQTHAPGGSQITQNINIFIGRNDQ